METDIGVVQELLQAHRRLATALRRSTVNGLSMGLTIGVTTIYGNPGISPSQLAAELVVSRARASALIASLEKAGYCVVERDRNGARLSLTPEGEAEARKYQESVAALASTLLEGVGADACRQMMDACDRLATKLESGGAPVMPATLTRDDTEGEGED